MKTTPLLILMLLAGCAPQQAETLNALLISPASGRVARGEALQLVATAVFSTGEVRDVTAETVWSVDDLHVGNLNVTPGLVRGLEAGRTVVRGQYAGLMRTRPLEVSDAQFRELRVEPKHVVAPLGLAVPMRVQVIASDGSLTDVTDEASFSVSNPTLAAAHAGLVTPLRKGELSVEVSARGLVLTTPITVTDATIAQLELSPSLSEVPAGLTQDFTAMATLTDGARLDVTRVARWQVADPSVASIDSRGVLRALVPGSVRVTAVAGEQRGVAQVDVIDARVDAVQLVVSPNRFAAGTRGALAVIATLSDGNTREVTSQSSIHSADEASLLIEGASARGLKPGVVPVTASFGELQSTVEVEVLDAMVTRLELITPRYVPVGASVQLVARARWSDGTMSTVSAVTDWVLHGTAAEISSTGVLTALQPGQVQLVAHFGGRTAVARVPITAARLSTLTLEPAALRLSRGTTQQLVVTAAWTDGTTLQLAPSSCGWRVPQRRVAAVSSTGLVRALSAGRTRVVVTCLGYQRMVELTVPDAHFTQLVVTPSSPAAPSGFGKHLRAVGTLSDGTTQDVTDAAVWSSQRRDIAIVQAGLVSAIRPGVTAIDVSMLGVSARTPFTVTDASVLSLEVTPHQHTTALGVDVPFTARAAFSDGTERDVTADVQWSSSDAALASVSYGLVTTLRTGFVTITAELANATTTADLTITAATLSRVTLTPATATLLRGRSLDLVLTGEFTDGSQVDLSAQALWSSSAAQLAVVNAHGRVDAVLPGVVTITAQLGRFAASSTVTVTTVEPVSLSVSTPHAVLALGGSTQVTAWALMSDGSMVDVSSLASWSVGDGAVLLASSADDVRAAGLGTSTLTATWSGLTASTTFTVTPWGQLLSISLMAPEHVVVGDVVQLTAWGEYSDGSTHDLTALAHWSTVDVLVMQLTAPGVFTALSAGGAFIAVTHDGQHANVMLQVQE